MIRRNWYGKKKNEWEDDFEIYVCDCKSTVKRIALSFPRRGEISRDGHQRNTIESFLTLPRGVKTEDNPAPRASLRVRFDVNASKKDATEFLNN